MRCLVTAGKHAHNMQAIAGQLPMTAIEELLDAVFLLGLHRGYITRTPGRLSSVQLKVSL
jgi:hypothetical protein